MNDKVKAWGTAICITLFFLSFWIAFVLLCTPIYRGAIDWFHLETLTGLSSERLVQNYEVLIEYLMNPFQTTLQFPDFISSSSGLFHFQEVKQLFHVNFIVLCISSIGAGVLWYRYNQSKQLWRLIRPLSSLMVAPCVIVGAVLLFFDRLFIIFHQLFFQNDAWLFNPYTDPIILALPQEFFMLCFSIVFCMLLICLYATIKICHRRTYRILEENHQ